MPRRLTPDMWLFGAAVVLVSAGVVMVYSASAIVAADRFHDPYFFLKKQLFWAVLGAAALWVALRVDYRLLEKAVLPARRPRWRWPACSPGWCSCSRISATA
jgi:cell division protein FtsW